MIKHKKVSPLDSGELWRTLRCMVLYHNHGWGVVALVSVVLVLSLLGGLRLGQGTGVYLAGEIAERDVVADREMLVEDSQATQARRERARALQPLVFDLNKDSMSRFREDTLSLLHALNTRGLEESGLEAVKTEFNSRHGTELESKTFRLLSDPKVQTRMLNDVLPWLEGFLAAGVLPDMRLLSTAHNTVIVRDVETGGETLRTQAGGLHDQRSLLVALGQNLRGMSDISVSAKNAVQEVLPFLMLPTLSLNQDATNQRNTEILQAVEPVLYRVQRGEVMARAGDVVTLEQQVKMQSLFGVMPKTINPLATAGMIALSLVLMLGLFMTPSGSKGTVLLTKDQNFIALLLLVFGVAAWGLAYVLFAVAEAPTATALAYAFPVAGGAGLAALIFAARRYCTLCLLLSLFITLMMKGELALFLFYFLSCMVNTWLVLRAQSRQDVVWSGLPLFVWLLVTGFAAAGLESLSMAQVPVLVLALGVNTLMSVLLLFALSPILEMLMGYTTRFRLMELMNLEQPLLRELMMTTPGTYHHSLVVSHLVEAGASAVAANSLLCKVGALYHDIGKLSRPDYFVENQFGGPNPHEKLSPAMSSLILCSHVKQGIELATEHKLGAEIVKIIGQHHGNRNIHYFYQKALDMGENPRAEDYSYPGPRPQSREAAIVMMADAVEASSRTLVDPTSARIRSHVENIVKGIYEDGQLDETDLTFKELSKLIDSFSRILTGIFHQRIVYPERSDVRKGSGERKDSKSDVSPNFAVNTKPADVPEVSCCASCTACDPKANTAKPSL